MSLKTMYVSYFLSYEDARTVMLLSPSDYKKTHIQLQSNLRICVMLSPSLLISTEIGLNRQQHLHSYPHLWNSPDPYQNGYIP